MTEFTIETTAAFYTEHDEIVGLRGGVEGHVDGSVRPLGVISPAGLIAVAAPYDDRNPVPQAILLESCSACAEILLHRHFPTVAAEHSVDRTTPPVRSGGAISFRLKTRGRRTAMG